MGLAIAGPLDPVFPGFVNIISAEGSGSLEGSQSGSCFGGCSSTGSWTSVAVRKLAWEEVSCMGDATGVFLRESLLPEAVSLGMLCMCGFGELQFQLVGDLGLVAATRLLMTPIRSASLMSGKSSLTWISLL